MLFLSVFFLMFMFSFNKINNKDVVSYQEKLTADYSSCYRYCADEARNCNKKYNCILLNDFECVKGMEICFNEMKKCRIAKCS